MAHLVKLPKGLRMGSRYIGVDREVELIGEVLDTDVQVKGDVIYITSEDRLFTITTEIAPWTLIELKTDNDTAEYQLQLLGRIIVGEDVKLAGNYDGVGENRYYRRDFKLPAMDRSFGHFRVSVDTASYDYDTQIRFDLLSSEEQVVSAQGTKVIVDSSGNQQASTHLISKTMVGVNNMKLTTDKIKDGLVTHIDTNLIVASTREKCREVFAYKIILVTTAAEEPAAGETKTDGDILHAFAKRL